MVTGGAEAVASVAPFIAEGSAKRVAENLSPKRGAHRTCLLLVGRPLRSATSLQAARGFLFNTGGQRVIKEPLRSKELP